jgi:hypothetical protein
LTATAGFGCDARAYAEKPKVPHGRNNVSALRVSLLGFLLLALTACPSPSNTAQPTTKIAQQNSSAPKAEADELKKLVGRIWRVSNSPGDAAAGAIYIFLPNGTLLETSCVETYRVATWTADQKDSRALRVVEDQRPAFTATVGEMDGNTLHLNQQLLQGKGESRSLTLTPIDQEFVCPDLRK